MKMEESAWLGTNPKYVKGTYGRSQFKDFLNNPEFSDVKIFCGNKEFFGHKIVLSSASEVFRTMLSTEWCNVNHLTLEENCMMEDVFEQFMEFLYTWEIIFCEENVTPLLMLADKYMIGDLITQGIKYMEDTLSKENVIPWYRFALQFNIEALYEKCVTYLGTNFDLFCSSGELQKLEVNELMPILDSGMLVTKSELQVFHLVVKWIRCYDRAMDLEESTKDMANLMTLVRFPMMTPKELETAENVKEIWDESLRKHFLTLYQGYKFHSTGLIQSGAQDDKYYIPRIYIREVGGIHIPPSVNSHIFFTQSHMSQKNQANTIRWTYKKISDHLKIAYVNNSGAAFTTQFPIKVRFVVMVRPVADKERINILYDAMLTLNKDTLHVNFGFHALCDQSIRQNGFILSILPISV